MLKGLSNHLAVGLGTRLDVSNSEIEVYAYGLEICLGMLVKFTLLAFLAIALNLVWPVIMVSVGLCGFRILGGGSHLSTYLRCLVFGLAVFLGLAWLSTLPTSPSLVLLLLGVSVVLSIAVIIFRIPAGTEKKTVTDPTQIAGQKKKSLVFMLIWGLACLELICQGQVAMSHALVLGGLMGIFSISSWGYSMTHGFDILFNKMERRLSNG